MAEMLKKIQFYMNILLELYVHIYPSLRTHSFITWHLHRIEKHEKWKRVIPLTLYE